MSHTGKKTPRTGKKKTRIAVIHLVISVFLWALAIGLPWISYESLAAGYFAAMLGSWALYHAIGVKVNPLYTGWLVALMVVGYAFDSDIYWRYLFFGLNAVGTAAPLLAQKAPNLSPSSASSDAQYLP
jgi:hypothetical protein